MEKRDTIPQIIRSNCAKWGPLPAMSMKMFGIWHSYSWQDYYENVKCFSLGLLSLGLERGDVVCIIGDNEPQWFWGEFAVQAAGAIATGIFVDSIPSEVKPSTLMPSSPSSMTRSRQISFLRSRMSYPY
jgi:long-chain acyl-CoA synthetase